MDILDAIKKLADAARDETVPETDVAAAVLQRVQEEREPVILPFGIFATASAAAAAVMLAVTAYSWAAWNDPLFALFAHLRMVML